MSRDASEIKVGDLLYRHQDMRGWTAAKITRETKSSWIVPHNGKEIKVPKRGLLVKSKGMRYQWYTKDGKADADFCARWARDIGSSVSVCNDAEKLVAIAAILGKTLK